MFNSGALQARNTIIYQLFGSLGSDNDHNLIGVDARLGPLQDNGGPTQTMALLAGSPAISAGDATAAPDFDQRGFARVVGGTIDIGAFELQPAGTATHYRVSAPAAATAASAFNVTVTALDDYGNAATGYTGTVHFSSSDGRAILPDDYTFTSNEAGVHTFPVTLKTLGNQTVVATDSATGLIHGSATVPVRISHYSVSAPSSATAGSRFSVTVTALDAEGNIATGYAGTVRFSTSDGQAVRPGDYTFTSSDTGVHTFSNGFTFRTAGDQTITATDTAAASITGSATVTVRASHFRVSAPATATAGSPISVTIANVDDDGNIATGYIGTVHFGISDGQGVLAGNYTFTSADAGAHTFSNGFTFRTAGNQTITATDTAAASITGSATVTVTAAAADRLYVRGPVSISAGTPFDLVVTLQDQYFNQATSYTGMVTFSSSDAQAALPENYAFTAADGGAHTFTVTLRTAGSQTITVADTATTRLAGEAALVTEYAIPTANAGVMGITTGPDGNLWFAERSARKIGRLTPAGTFTEFSLPTSSVAPTLITSGPGGDLWFTIFNGIARITPAGTITAEFQFYDGAHALVAGPDENLWFTPVGVDPDDPYEGPIVRMTPAGVFTAFRLPGFAGDLQGLTVGPDGNLWFVGQRANKIGAITTDGTFLSAWTIPTANSGPLGIAAGADGNVWFTESRANKIGRVTPAGSFTEFPLAPGSSPSAIVAGPEGNIWFTEAGTGKLGRITPAGVITEVPLPSRNTGLQALTTGPDGSLWFTESSTNKVGRLTPAIMVTPAAADHLLFLQQPTDTAAGQTITPAVTVAVVDPFGNVITSDNLDTVTLTIGTNPSGGTLSGTLTVTVSGGVATFDDLSIDLAGIGYTLHAMAAGLTDADSLAFRIT
jgi:streptogramin lyase